MGMVVGVSVRMGMRMGDVVMSMTMGMGEPGGVLLLAGIRGWLSHSTGTVEIEVQMGLHIEFSQIVDVVVEGGQRIVHLVLLIEKRSQLELI